MRIGMVLQADFAICMKRKVKAIFNVTNFGQFNSPFYAMCQATGDCVICMCCDFQDLVELIPTFVHEWEKGHKIVSGIKTSSRENKIVYLLRTVYYKMIKNMSTAQMIEHFTGFGLYDKTFISILRQLDDPIPFIRGIVVEYGHAELYFLHQGWAAPGYACRVRRLGHQPVHCIVLSGV